MARIVKYVIAPLLLAILLFACGKIGLVRPPSSPAPEATPIATPIAVTPTKAPIATEAPSPAVTRAPTSNPVSTPTPGSVKKERFVGLGDSLPVALSFAPDGRLFYTALFGEFHAQILVADTGPNSEPRVPKVFFDFEHAGISVSSKRDWGVHGIDTWMDGAELWVYVSYIHGGTTGPGGSDPDRPRVIKIRDDNGRGTDPKIIIDGFPPCRLFAHCGGNIHFGPEGLMYVSIAGLTYDVEGLIWPQEVIAAHQEIKLGPNFGYGAIYRFNSDGTPATGNPFPKNPGLYAYGFHNAWDFAFQPVNGRLFAIDVGEMGPLVGGVDELNLVEPGKNYGWPLYSGINKLWGEGAFFGYRVPIISSGSPVYVFDTEPRPGITDPVGVFYGVPRIGDQPALATPIGAIFYSGKKFTSWAGDLLLCELNTTIESGEDALPGAISRYKIDFSGPWPRMVFMGYVVSRCAVDIEEGPDGSIYFTWGNAIFRITD
ncbi:MAG: PQQ-dependent sugar dehydrogenase [Chloroflexi bacterium]|nr:PQQ-dependent sugar dehydrogenase [Chloroflexota bacterium]